MFTWFKALGWVWKLVLVAALALFIFLAYNFVDDLFSKEDEVRAELSENQAEAAVESGKDAVSTITIQNTRETERIETVRVIQNEVNNAQDFTTAHDAGSYGLCNSFGVCSEEQMQPAG
jgi:hypothetical protein